MVDGEVVATRPRGYPACRMARLPLAVTWVHRKEIVDESGLAAGAEAP